MRTKVLPDVSRAIRQSRKLALKDGYFYVKAEANQINLIGTIGKIRSEEQRLVEATNTVIRLRIGVTNAFILSVNPKEEESEVIAFYKNRPIFQDFIIAEIYDVGNSFENNLGELSLVQAFSALSSLTFPNAENLILTVTPS